ncbi:MAG TPA: ATPase, T2SS/T4P/T4SS family [Candidatus Gastranaerophilaceae bacterium]|nr:ATPase, T2SS/T4P/T4SS family [Candidatus Gastranaerophilaceae bacterium]HPT41818.1 ATPase, T2SS/T4P/T4SS family [Candidatus Gastranaerophilaceae bacterium]
MENVLEKLKDSINKDIVAKFNKTILENYQFLPINMKGECLYVATNPSAEKETIAKVVKSMGIVDVKFIQIAEVEVDALLKYVYGDDSGIKKLLEEAKNKTQGQTQEQNPANGEEAPKKKIGEILIEKGYINEEQLQKALEEGKRLKMPLGSALFKLGFITLSQLKETLKDQQGYDMVDSDQLKVQEKVINMLPEDFVRANKVIPISSDGSTLVVGMVKPDNKKVLKDIVFLTGQKPRAMLITHFEFQSFVETEYSATKKETNKIIKEIEEENLEFTEEESLADQVERELQDTSGTVVKFVNKIITDAIDNKVSDIHIEPRLENYVVRYRKDGILRQIIEVPPRVEMSVITRFKVISRMNIAERRRPQDGTFSLKYKGSSYDFRINTLPVGGKEKVCIRVLAPAVSLNSSDKEIHLMGGMPEDIEKIKKMTSCPNGIILTSGPTGSGKTTTLYSVLKSLNDEEVNITTIEDPVEIKLEGLNQSQVNAKAGITFASCMRAILRQDPDIILVGEIRDYETLEVAISAALTGHLVLSTVHTNSAAATVTRLVEMGAKDYLVSSTLSGVIAQRLVRKLCDDCKDGYFPSKEEASKILIDEGEIEKFTKTKVYRPIGCSNCDYTGFKGRLGVYEIMPITKEIKKLIATGAHDIDIEEAAIACGMKTLNQACLSHIINGFTTIDEFVRVLGLANE